MRESTGERCFTSRGNMLKQLRHQLCASTGASNDQIMEQEIGLVKKYDKINASIKEEDLMVIHQVTGFKIGVLPVKYLGVPLVTRQLTGHDCAPLVEKITARVRHWATKFLSYAGRLQLIQSVLFNIQNYWCRHFILPKSVMKKISQICSSFFWKGDDKPAKGARVSWSTICHPKNEGGLGVKELVSWNKACIMQNIWAILSQAGSLWIAWIHAYVLRGRSFWQVSALQNSSWGWRKLLHLRALANRFVEWQNGVAVWKIVGDKYSVAKVWEEIRSKQDKVQWHRLLWTPLAIPRHSVITWMALLNRLPTMDRLTSWGIRVAGTCLLCQNEMETRNHLFFGCGFSRGVWKDILQLCGLSRDVMDWDAELNWAIRKLKGKSLLTLILRIAWRAFVYFIWAERNSRLYNHTSKTGCCVLEQVKGIIRLKISRLSDIKDDLVNRILCNNWGLSLF